MDNQFKTKLADLCSQAFGDENERKDAIARCANLGLSSREEFILNAIFGPTQENIIVFLRLYETYLPYLRGQKDNGRFIGDWKSANTLIVDSFNLTKVETFGMYLHSLFAWNGQVKYGSSISEVVKKFEEYTSGTFDFTDLSEVWSEAYYRLSLLIVSENLQFLPENIQMLFVGTNMLFESMVFGVNVDKCINQSISYYPVLKIRHELSSAFAVFLYGNDQTIGVNPETGEPTLLAYWIDKFEIFSNKKFDGLSLINFVKEDTTWGTQNDNYVRQVIQSVLMIYGHLVSGYYVTPPTDESVVRISPPEPIEPEVPSHEDIKEMVQEEVVDLSDDDKPAAIIDSLNDISTHYNDPAIADLYYFDEQSNEFKWRE